MIKEAEAYFAEASRWETDRQQLVLRSARRAWIVAGIATLTTVATAGAVAALAPLKQVVPFLVRVDSSTGVVDVVPRYDATEELPQTVTRHLVSEYVIQRERFIGALAEEDYDQIGAFHSAAMNQAWAAAWSRSNPESPLNLNADGTRIRVQVQSVTFLRHQHGSPDVVQVRFLAARQRGGGASEETSHFLATLQTTYAAPSADVRLRALNPLGFKVLEYRREPEVVDAPAAGATAMAAGGAP